MTAIRPLATDAAGLGLRRALMGPLRDAAPGAFDFLECAPDNWVGVGGRLGAALQELAGRYPLVCHGLSLNLGGMLPFDQTWLLRLRRFLDAHRVPIFSEHLSYCGDDGQLYDLMPIPFTDEAVHHVAGRIREVQDTLGRRIAIENVSYYAAPFQALAEIDFVNAVLDEADCDLLLDVNNVFVNSINHRYDARDYIARLPGRRVAYMHIAGHYDEADDLKVDTHGAAVKDDVWQLLDFAYATHGVRPTLLERDFNFPPLSELVAEVQHIRSIQRAHNAITEAQHVRA
ncbi:MAG TPA: DUF692 domain-containing protein [Arenimonas sp.]|nr:DUF692 domain-containing protein [Arenimonas sp.]